MEYLLGLDIGTGGIKALLIDRDGNIHASHTTEISLQVPKPLWAEQNPDDWWQAVVESTHAVMAKASVLPAAIKGIGLSGQMHSLVVTDAQDAVLRPAILWCDNRTLKQRRWIEETLGLETIRQWTGNPPLEGFTVPKLVWMRENEPDLYRRITKVFIAKDYIRYRITDEWLSEVSDAAGSAMFDITNRTWSAPYLDAIDIPCEILPECRESVEICGCVTETASKELGLAKGTPVVGGGADNPSSAVGNGIVREGRISASIGTSGVMFAHADTPKIDTSMRVHSFCHCVPFKWYLMGVVLTAGGALRWYRDTLGAEEIIQAGKKGVDPYEVLTAKAAEAKPGSDGLVFLPYFSGERTPHQDATVRGGWIGLTLSHNKSHLVRSLLEGVTFALRDSLEILKELGIDVTQVRVTGGGAKNRFWQQMQADIYQTEVATMSVEEGPALGAALMAGVGAGWYDAIDEISDTVARVHEIIEPDSKKAVQYNEFYSYFKTLYPALRKNFQTIHTITNSQHE